MLHFICSSHMYIYRFVYIHKNINNLTSGIGSLESLYKGAILHDYKECSLKQNSKKLKDLSMHNVDNIDDDSNIARVNARDAGGNGPVFNRVTEKGSASTL